MRRRLTRPVLAAALPLLTALWTTTPERAQAAPDWAEALGSQVQKLERETPGQFGLYVKRLDTGETFAWQADRRWYLASSAKLPLAIAVLQEVQQGHLRLDEELRVEERDKIDGSGALVWQPVGTQHSIETLLRRMLMDSDNTAANLLIRTIGPDTFNTRAQALMGARNVGTLTSFTQVRQEVYGELHPRAKELKPMDLVRVAAAPMGPQRVQAVARALDLKTSELQAKTMEEAYDRYYARGANTATLAGYGGMLEKLVRGQLLTPPHQQMLYKDLKFDTYDAYRLEAGLPRTVRFIHKTGTQYHRACHMGVIDPQEGGARAIVVATCAEGMDEMRQAGRLFEQIGRAITRTLLKDRPAAQAAEAHTRSTSAP
ncbi:serine hydrolase [Paracidovorax cattleyae]|uniref:serine hydrolase n=1 Tax=Paracidovorax cattleyae TaxID=80868 RepID=UPI0018AFAF4A|nr:serine hydrolase [Paracidovorax cattleyae]MBF9267224.1 serine hydrolase [Paracidovorax cattleyae]